MATERRKRTSFYCGPRNSIVGIGESRDARVAHQAAQLAAMEATGQWAFEVKHDGFWCKVEVVDGIITSLESRVGVEIATATDGLLGLRLAGGGTGTLVGELVADLVDGEHCGTRRVALFDILEWNGIALRDATLSQRRQALEMVHAAVIGDCDRLPLVEQRTAGIAEWYIELIAGRAEGLVAKRLDSGCRSALADGKVDFWVRCKPARTAEFIIMGQGVAKKTGTSPGGSPNLQLGLYKVCSVQGLKVVHVMDCVIPPFLNGVDLDSVVGRVVEVSGAEVFPSGCIRHGHIQRFRDDKLPEHCTHEAAMAA